MTADGFDGDMPLEARLLAQALSEGFEMLNGTLTRLGDSESVVTPRHTHDGHPEGEPCQQMDGDDYPKHWTTCEEAAWQALVEDVDTDLWFQSQRYVDIAGERFGHLVAVAPIDRPEGRTGSSYWTLRCDCGEDVSATLSNLTAARRVGRDMKCRTCIRGQASYKTMHTRVNRERGRARAHTCICGAAARDWAYDHQDEHEVEGQVTITGKVTTMIYSTDIEHYVPLCRACHIALDSASKVAS